MVPAISDVMEPKRHVVWLPWLLHVVRCFSGSRLGWWPAIRTLSRRWRPLALSGATRPVDPCDFVVDLPPPRSAINSFRSRYEVAVLPQSASVVSQFAHAGEVKTPRLRARRSNWPNQVSTAFEA